MFCTVASILCTAYAFCSPESLLRQPAVMGVDSTHKLGYQSVHLRGSNESTKTCDSVWSTVTVGRRWRIKMQSLTPCMRTATRGYQLWWNCRLAWSHTRRKTSNFPTDLLHLSADQLLPFCLCVANYTRYTRCVTKLSRHWWNSWRAYDSNSNSNNWKSLFTITTEGSRDAAL